MVSATVDGYGVTVVDGSSRRAMVAAEETARKAAVRKGMNELKARLAGRVDAYMAG